jgi:hypothetical protein
MFIAGLDAALPLRAKPIPYALGLVGLTPTGFVLQPRRKAHFRILLRPPQDMLQQHHHCRGTLIQAADADCTCNLRTTFQDYWT